MADWSGVYTFDSGQDLTTRVTRLERGEQYFRAGKLVTPSGKFAGIPVGLLDSSNKISIVTGVTAIGSIPPAGVTGKFAFTATSTSITIYWDGTNTSVLLSVLRADKTAEQIPGNNLTISGLTPSTTYGFLPFWSPFVNCGVGFVVGDSGTPQFAFSPSAQTIANGMQQLQTGREALTNGFITWPTPASGSSGPGGGTVSGSGGAGGPGCVMLNTKIKPLADSQEYSTFHMRQTDWLNFVVENTVDCPTMLNCTPDHPLYHADKGKIRADEFQEGDWIITDHGEQKLSRVAPFYRDCTKVKVEMPSGHLFFANGFLSHNFKPA